MSSSNCNHSTATFVALGCTIADPTSELQAIYTQAFRISDYKPPHRNDHRLSFNPHLRVVISERGDGWMFGLIDEVSRCCFSRNWKGSVKSNTLSSVKKNDWYPVAYWILKFHCVHKGIPHSSRWHIVAIILLITPSASTTSPKPTHQFKYCSKTSEDYLVYR